MKLRDQQIKTTLYIYRLLYQNIIEPANQKTKIDIHTKKNMQPKCNTKDSYQTGRQEQKKGRKKTNKNKSKKIKKMVIEVYILIITWHVNNVYIIKCSNQKM